MKSIQDVVAGALARMSLGLSDSFAPGSGRNGANFGPAASPMMGLMTRMPQAPAPAPRNRPTFAERRNFVRANIKLFWIAAIVVSVALTTLLFYASPLPMKGRFVLATIYWAVLMGGSALLLVPSKIIVAGFGGLVGSSASDAATGAGIITALHKSVTDMADQLGVVAEDLGVAPDLFFKRMVWLFVGIVIILLLPAFFDEKIAAASGGHNPRPHGNHPV